MKIVITGGAGFIGKWLVRSLPINAEIIIIDSIEEQAHQSKLEFAEELRERAICIKADIRDQDAYACEMEGSDIVVHLAAQTGTVQSMSEISMYVQHNVDGTAKLLEVINGLKQKPRRIVLTSSRTVYGEGAFADGSTIKYVTGRRLEDLQAGNWEIYNENGQELEPLPMNEEYLTNPTSVYGMTKLWQEQLIENYAKNQEIDYVIFRLQNVYGPEQELHNPYVGVIGLFTNSITQKGEANFFEDGKQTRDFVYVKDVAEALSKVISYEGKLSRIFNIGNGTATSLLEMADLIGKLSKKGVKPKFSGQFRLGDIRHGRANMKQYESIFGEWKPISLEEGLSNYLKWYFEQEPLSNNRLAAWLKEMEDKKLLIDTK